VEVGSLVMCDSFRNPALLAKMAVTADAVSDGRLVLGLGAGWYDAEYVAFGYATDHRVRRFEEALQIITALLSGDSVSSAAATTACARPRCFRRRSGRSRSSSQGRVRAC
jgi:alkanesulfonate monooxygenase SsuD/methylene tetrahydromethanopterin reductase-like flavin-dependent oxidoreductase (luciferase family)